MAFPGSCYCLDELSRDHLGWSTTHAARNGRFFILEHLLHNVAAMWQKVRERTTQRHPRVQLIEMAKVMATAHPSVRTLMGATDGEILDWVEKVYQREYVLAPSVLPQ